MSQNHVSPVRRSLSKKLLARVLLASSAVTCVITAAQLTLDYRKDVSTIERNLDQIQETYLPGIAKSLWDMNDEHLKVELGGIINIPDVLRAEIEDVNGNREAAGAEPTGEFVQRVYELRYGNPSQLLGRMTVVATLENSRSRLYHKIAVVFITQFAKTLIVSLLILMIIRQLITRHLVGVSNHLGRIRFGESGSDAAFALDRAPTAPQARDEFDVLVDVTNEMRSVLSASYSQLERFNRELEAKVEERTQIILDQRQKLEYASKMSVLGEMAGGVAHEMNTPLAIMRTGLEQLSELIEEGGQDRESILKINRSVQATVDRIAKIVAGLRSFAGGPGTEIEGAFTLKQLIDGALVLCENRFNDAGVSVEVMGSAADLSVKCRKTEIVQVLFHLLTNAFDAVRGKSGCWIRIETGMNDGYAEISVVDSDLGIAPEIAEKIMQPFFTTKPIGQGAGLGLSISRGVAESHGGSLDYDRRSANTRFTLRLPIPKALAA